MPDIDGLPRLLLPEHQQLERRAHAVGAGGYSAGESEVMCRSVCLVLLEAHSPLVLFYSGLKIIYLRWQS
jgi:hypothetical protein